MFRYPPLNSRILRAKEKPAGSWQPDTTSQRGGMKYRMWDTESMERAVADVDMGMSLRMAADLELYGIHKTTVNDYVLGKREFGAKSG